jgi:hypothetical protein
MHYVQQMNPQAGPYASLPPLRVSTLQPSRWERFSTRMKETGMVENLTESILVVTTFSLVGGMLFSLYRALEYYTIIPLP